MVDSVSKTDQTESSKCHAMKSPTAQKLYCALGIIAGLGLVYAAVHGAHTGALNGNQAFTLGASGAAATLCCAAGLGVIFGKKSKSRELTEVEKQVLQDIDKKWDDRKHMSGLKKMYQSELNREKSEAFEFLYSSYVTDKLQTRGKR